MKEKQEAVRPPAFAAAKWKEMEVFYNFAENIGQNLGEFTKRGGQTENTCYNQSIRNDVVALRFNNDFIKTMGSAEI